MQRQTKAYLFAASAVLLWSTVASAFKLALRVLSPVQLVLTASFFSMLALLGVLLVQGKLGQLRRTTSRDLLTSLLLGLLNPFLYYLVLFEAYRRLPGQEAQPLNYTWALALPLLSIPLLKQRIRPLSLMAILVSLVGVYVIATRGAVLAVRFTDPLGVGLALGSSLVWALYWIYNLRDQRDAVAKLFLNFVAGFLLILVYAARRGELGGLTLPGLLGGAYAGCFEMGLTFVLWLKALGYSRTTAQVANLIFLAPFVSLVLLHGIAGEQIYASSIIGLALIVAGILLQRRWG